LALLFPVMNHFGPRLTNSRVPEMEFLVPSNTIDVAALAQLRPGMPMSRLSQALGAHWRPLTSEDEGWVKTAHDLENGFSARVDIHA
jgi:hypothetical protein